jgi:hypothetical protein
MKMKSFAWFWMTLLAFAVAGYAGAMLFAVQFRPELVRTLFDERPMFAFAHFGGGAIALVTGAFQLNSKLRNRFIAVHRWFGRLYVIAIGIGGAASLYLAFKSLGGLVAHAGFGLLAVSWLGSTFIAYRHIRNRNLGAHRSWMIRSYSLTLAAVTLRIYLPLSQIAGLSFVDSYPVISWICWVPNLLIAEWLVRSGGTLAVSSNSSLTAKPLSN